MATNKKLSQGRLSGKIGSLGKIQNFIKNSGVSRWMHVLIVRAIQPNVKFGKEVYNVMQK